MDGNDEVFTVTVQNGQFVLTVDADVFDAYDPISLSSWVEENAERIDETVRVALTHEQVTANEIAAIAKRAAEQPQAEKT